MDFNLYIKYSQKQLRFSLLTGIVWLAFFVFYFYSENDHDIGYIYLAIGVFSLGTYVYKKTVHYATIKDGVLIRNQIIPKRRELNQIMNLKFDSGKYTFMTENSAITLNTMGIDTQSIEDLQKVIAQLKLLKS